MSEGSTTTFSCFHYAVTSCSLEVIEKLIEHGADVNSFRTRVCLSRQQQSASSAITNDKNIKKVTALSRHVEKLTPIQIALVSKRYDIVRFLASRVDLSIPFQIGSETGFMWKLAEDCDIVN
jgi:ankyrin repeat protein